MGKKRAVLLVNLGSPASPSVKDVRKYLNEFLMDKRVLDAPYPIRRMIVSGFILPFRPKKSAEAYSQIWWEDGSPLIVISKKVQRLLRERMEMPVGLAMSYGNPSIKETLQDLIVSKKAEEILLIPLYPHYAMSTYETVVAAVKKHLARMNPAVSLKIVPPFYKESHYIDALAASAESHLKWDYDHLLFSYHGLPERHLKKTDPTGNHCLVNENCCSVPSPAHDTCYRAQVFKTTEELVKKSGIPLNKYSVSFQSRLGRDAWLGPFTSEEIVRLANEGVKKLLVICPAFVSDCLETLEEIGLRGKEAFLEAGGEEFRVIPCLNDHPKWIDALKIYTAYEMNE
ncbi:MAG: ferrochelatase [Calditrichaceae bacterium]